MSRTIPISRPRGGVDRLPSDYTIQKFLVADAIEELPGDEIIVLHNSSGDSPGVIRIHDFAGTKHFEAWHFGYVARVQWWAEAKLIVCAGDRHLRREVGDYGYAGAPWPRIVFALRPKLGAMVGWVNEVHWPEARRTGPEPGETLAWYKVMHPVDIEVDHADFAYTFGPNGIEIRPATDSRESLVAVDFASTDFGGFRMHLNGAGEIVGRTGASDEFKLSRYADSAPTLLAWPPPRSPLNDSGSDR